MEPSDKDMIVEENIFNKLTRKEIYTIYGRIRYIVQDDHCKPIAVSEVINTINDESKEELNRLFNYSVELIDYVLEYVKSHAK